MAPCSQEFQEEPPFSLLDALYCEEEKWEDEVFSDASFEDEEFRRINNGGGVDYLLPLLLLEQDLFWEDEELRVLFAKEKDESFGNEGGLDVISSLSFSRSEAVEWILKVNSYYGFCTLTSVLAVNYLDRFISSFCFQKDKPWMFQLSAVTCLSLAAKVEETYVPLLLDLQVCLCPNTFLTLFSRKETVLLINIFNSA